MKKLISLILCISLICSLAACGAGESVPVMAGDNGEISLWYAEDGSDVFSRLTELCERFGGESGIEVETRAFSSDTALVEELVKHRSPTPDLVLCSRDAAISLAGEGIGNYTGEVDLSSISVQENYLASGVLNDAQVFFPVAAAAETVMYNTAALETLEGRARDILSTLESLCQNAVVYENSTGSHFFTARSFSDLFSYCLRLVGSELHAERELDIENEQYVYLYNLLAEAAYNGGVTAYDENAAELVAAGELAAAVVSSVDVMRAGELDAESVAFLPMPAMDGTVGGCLVKLMGFAVTTGSQSQQALAAQFMLWLMQNSAELCGESGWFSASTTLSSSSVNGSQPQSEILSAMHSVISRAVRQRGVTFPQADADYFKNSTDFEISFRETLNGLN